MCIDSHYKRYHLSKIEEEKKHISTLDREVCKSHKAQIHIYSDCYFAENRFAELFKELFVPVKALQERIDVCTKSIGVEYEAVTLRFQQLLGDFKEGKGKLEVLESDEKDRLIEKCTTKLETLYNGSHFKTKKLLVTSDSVTFLNRVKSLDYVYIIPGKIVHMGFTKDADDFTYMKSFVDLLMLSKAQRVTLLKTGKMYDSGFPQFAALLGNIEFSRIEW